MFPLHVLCNIPHQNQVLQADLHAEGQSSKFDGIVDVDWVNPLLHLRGGGR